MCGIAGILNFGGAQSSHGKPLYQMVSHMAHRGPDDEGYVFFSVENEVQAFYGSDTVVVDKDERGTIVGFPYMHIDSIGDRQSFVALGHRRLSIVDLSPSGHQPMGSSDGHYWIVFNGEIYNFAEIAEELKQLGVTFKGCSDTEVLLNAYIMWGDACLQKINGMFAFAIWDCREKILFCARDRIGIKPFYYTVQDEQFIFASDIKAIIASGLYTPEIDVLGLYLSMAFGIAPRPKTAFKNIVALEQAHWMRIYSDGRIEKQRYWSIPIGTQDFKMREVDAVDLLEEKLILSIKRRLVSDVPVGTFMSGGIDSTTISSIASTIHPGIKAFTLGYENNAPELDEVSQAQATSRMYSIEHIVHRVNPIDSLQDLQSWIRGYEEPFYSLAPNYVISKLVRDNGIKVVLNGLGGDELFAGYDVYSHIGRWKLLRVLKPFIGIVSSFVPRYKNQLKLLSQTKSADRYHTLLFALTCDNDLRQLFTDPVLSNINTAEELHYMYADGLQFTDDIEAISYMDLMNYIGNHHVHRSDQFSMAHSVESRFPFLDHELVEAAFSIPSKFKICGKIQKYVLRKVAEKYIAPECLSMKKKGFGLPLQQWMDGPLKPLIEKSLVDLELRDEIRNGVPALWFKQYKKGRRSYCQLWHLVALEMWFGMFIDRKNLYGI